MDNNATDSVDAMAYALLSKKWPAAYPELIREVRREVQWLRGFVPHPEAEMSLKIGVFTKTFRIARNYDGWAISDVLEDMAQMFRGKESAGVKPPLDLISKMDDAAFVGGLPYVHWDKAPVAPACEHCGGQPQKWDSDARCMVSGGECEHCGAGKDGV